ncbi:MAG: aspartate aminotransferase family protein [Lachnospiraceae bacterium]|nr:aspartate aminotransferase family protein [Clostridiaceae bacterium]MDY3825906.1 aspartate aminotransferase family protein [Lachnospiraceae bacterium]
MSNPYIEEAEEAILHTYNRYQIVLDRGEGVHLYDVNGKEYLDFAAGIAVQSLGYNNKEYTQALKDQIDKLTHISNLYYSVPMAEAAEKVKKASRLEKVFFTNSGTEAIEGALKVARKYSYAKYGEDRYEIVAMNHSFHGRSLGALSVTGNEKYRKPFEPLIGGVRFADYNDLESVKSQVNEKTCAIILETVQGEGGIYPATEEFLKGVKALCEEKDLILILDEIQCGMGRTGYMFAWQEYGVEPDVMTCAKALGCGVPVGAFVLGKKVADASLAPGDHGTTYGGNPFVCAAVSKVFDLYEKEQIVDHVKKVGGYLEKKLNALVEKYDFLKERRGKGLIQGLEVEGRPIGEIVNRGLEEGLIIITAGSNVLRFVPPLVVTEADVDEMIAKLEKCF